MAAAPAGEDLAVQVAHDAQGELDRGAQGCGLGCGARVAVVVEAPDGQGRPAAPAGGQRATVAARDVGPGLEVPLGPCGPRGQLAQAGMQPEREPAALALPPARGARGARLEVDDRKLLRAQAPPPRGHEGAHAQRRPVARAGQHDVHGQALWRALAQRGGDRQDGRGTGGVDRAGLGHPELQPPREQEQEHDRRRDLQRAEQLTADAGDACAARGHGEQHAPQGQCVGTEEVAAQPAPRPAPQAPRSSARQRAGARGVQRGGEDEAHGRCVAVMVPWIGGDDVLRRPAGREQTGGGGGAGQLGQGEDQRHDDHRRAHDGRLDHHQAAGEGQQGVQRVHERVVGAHPVGLHARAVAQLA